MHSISVLFRSSVSLSRKRNSGAYIWVTAYSAISRSTDGLVGDVQGRLGF